MIFLHLIDILKSKEKLAKIKKKKILKYLLKNVHVRGGARSIRSFHSHTQKAVKLGSFTAQPVRFTRLSVRSLIIASLFATSHPQSHSSVLKMSVAQFFPFKKVDKSEKHPPSLRTCGVKPFFDGIAFTGGKRENDTDITPRMLPKRSFLTGKWKRGELQKRFQ